MKDRENQVFLGLIMAFPILGCFGGGIWMIVEKMDAILIVLAFAVAVVLALLHVATLKGNLDARLRLGGIFMAASIGPVIGLFLNPTIETSELVEIGILKWIAFMLVYLGVGSWLVVTAWIMKKKVKNIFHYYLAKL